MEHPSLNKTNEVASGCNFKLMKLVLWFQDADLLSSHYSSGAQVAYILSLGVVKDFRRHGVGKANEESDGVP
jgi:hypothetical protein